MVRWGLARGVALGLCVLLAGCGDDEAEGCVCAGGASCDEAGACPDPGADGDGDGIPDVSDDCPDTAAGTVVNGAGCLFTEEGQGTGIREIAGDFTVQTLDGPFSFRGSWTGLESHIFFVRIAGSEYSEGVWESDVKALLEESPSNVHYHFLDATHDDAARVASLEALRDRFSTAMEALGSAAHWRERLHFVTDDVAALDGSLGEFVSAHAFLAFAIDRYQRWREVGALFDWNSNAYVMRFLGREAEGFEYERRLRQQLAPLDLGEAWVFAGERHPGGWEAGYSTRVEVEFPPAAELARYDSMAVHIYTACPEHLQGLQAGCNEWDYAHHLFLCDEADPERCDVELVRYVTPYGREGEWLTDISPLLPLLSSGGKRTLRYDGANGYDMYLRILFWDAGKSHRPVEARFLWGESGPIPWDGEYNARFESIRFTVQDPSTEKVEIFSVVTGHGFGSTQENCAEFCDSEHEFAVNGTLFSEKHPEARRRTACFDQVEAGVVPNQFGSWPFGRAGWCPGQDVKPWVQEVSEALLSGENEIAYRALFRGEPYTPMPNGQGDFMPELRLQSWLVRYEAK